MSMMDDFLSCDCCDVVCPAPVMVSESAVEECRFLGFKPSQEQKIYNSMKREKAENFLMRFFRTRFSADLGSGKYLIESEGRIMNVTTNGTFPNDHLEATLTMDLSYSSTLDQVICSFKDANHVSLPFDGVMNNVVVLDNVSQSESAFNPSPLKVDYDYADVASPGIIFSDSFNAVPTIASVGFSKHVVSSSVTFGFSGATEGQWVFNISGGDATPSGDAISVVTQGPDVFEVIEYGAVDDSFSNEIDDDYMCMNIPASQPPEDDEWGGSPAPSSVSVLSGIRFYEYNDPQRFFYYYRVMLKKWTRVKFEVPADFVGDFYEFEFKVVDQNDVEISNQVLQWARSTGSEEDYSTEYFDLPVPDNCVDEYSAIPIRYRCYHGGKWQSF